MRSPNDEGSQFSKLHFPCKKEERLVLNSFFRECNLYLKKKRKTLNLFKVAYHPVSCLLHLHTTEPKSSDKNNGSKTEKYQDHIPCSFAFKVIYIGNKFSKKVVLYRGKNAAHRSIEAIPEEYDYGKKKN